MLPTDEYTFYYYYCLLYICFKVSMNGSFLLLFFSSSCRLFFHCYSQPAVWADSLLCFLWTPKKDHNVSFQVWLHPWNKLISTRWIWKSHSASLKRAGLIFFPVSPVNDSLETKPSESTVQVWIQLQGEVTEQLNGWFQLCLSEKTSLLKSVYSGFWCEITCYLHYG